MSLSRKLTIAFCAAVFICVELVRAQDLESPAASAAVVSENKTLENPVVENEGHCTRLSIVSHRPLFPTMKKRGKTLRLHLPRAEWPQATQQNLSGGRVVDYLLEPSSRGTDFILRLTPSATAQEVWVETQKETEKLIVEVYGAVLPPPPAKAAPKKTSFWKKMWKPRAAKPRAAFAQAAPVIVAPRLPPQKNLDLAIRSDMKNKIRKIVVDAGHGGKDPGAISRKGLKEKDVNLDVALVLAHQLGLEGFEVFLTRTNDVFVPLEERSRFANEQDADLFISIHCNASISSAQHGFEVYFLSDAATDAAARAVAELENSAIQYETASGKSKKVEALLYSMAKNESLNEASLLGHWVAKKAGEKAKLRETAVKQANFYVLRGTEMPAILVELGYITHRDEEKLLGRKKFQTQIAEALVTAIQSYRNSVDTLR